MEEPVYEEDRIAATQTVDDRVLKDVIAYVEVRTTNDNRSEAIRRELKQLGATVVKKFSNDVTHVVFKEGTNRTKTRAQKKGVHFVSVLWVDSCKQNQDHVSERMYPAIVSKHKGANLFIAKMKKAKSMQPRDFEEELSRSADRISRKKRRLEALDRLHSAGSTPQSSPRMSRVLVQDTQPRSPDEGFILTPIRLAIPDTPPSMRERMKQLKIGKEGSYNEGLPDDRKLSSRDYLYDKEPLQRKLFMSAGVSFETSSSFNSPGGNSVFTSDDDTKDDTNQLSDDNDTEVEGDGCSPVATVTNKSAEKKQKAKDMKFSPIAENKSDCDGSNTSQIIGGESDSSVTEDILGIAGKINAMINKKRALDDSLNLDSDDSSGSQCKNTQVALDTPKLETRDSKQNSENKTEIVIQGCQNSNTSLFHDIKQKNVKGESFKKKRSESEVTLLKKNNRRKSQRISLQREVNKIQNADQPEANSFAESLTPVIVRSETNISENFAENIIPVSRKNEKDISKKGVAAEKCTEDTVLNEAASSSETDKHNGSSRDLLLKTTSYNSPEANRKVNKDNATEHETNLKDKRSKLDRRTQSYAEKETRKNKSMPKKKLLSLTDLNEPHSVLIEPSKCSVIERPEIVDNKPKGRRGRKKKDLNNSSDGDINMYPVDKENTMLKTKQNCSDAEITSDVEKTNLEASKIKEDNTSINLHCHEQKKTKRQKKKSEPNNENPETLDNLVHQNDTNGRKRNSELLIPEQVRGSKRRTIEKSSRNNQGNDITTKENKGNKRKSKKDPMGTKISHKHQRKDQTTSHSQLVNSGKELVRVNDTVLNEKETDTKSSVTSQLNDITTQLNLTANNSVTASLRDGTLSLSMSAVYNTDTTMQSFLVSQRKSIDEFNLSQKHKNKEKTRILLGSLNGDRKDLHISSSDSDNSVSGKSRKKFRPSLVMTSLHSHEQDIVISVVKKLGGFVIAETVNETTTHVICGDSRRTLNVLQCVARGAWLLNKSWVMQSLEAGTWIPEEEHECVEFFPVCKIARLERENSVGYYKQTLFSKVGMIYVSGRSSPPRAQLVQLIKLCGGHVTGVLSKASVYVGSDLHPDITCLKTQWILDCITQHRLLPLERFSLDRPKREASPVY